MYNKTKLYILVCLPVMLLTVTCKKDTEKSATLVRSVYFNYYNDNTVNRIDLQSTPNDYTSLYNHFDGLNAPGGIALTGDGCLVVTEENNNRILKMNKNGSGDITTLYDASDGVSTPTAVAVDKSNGTMYWCNSGSGQVFKGSTDGKQAPEALFGGAKVIRYAFGIAIDKKHDKLYFSDFYQYINVGNLDGSGKPTVVWDNNTYPDLSAPSNIYISGNRDKIFWCDEQADQIVEASLDGKGDPVVLFDHADGVSRPDGIFADEADDKIYWTETKGNVVARGNIDGSGEREVLVNHVISYAITLE
jgi:hypothetical protein